MGCRGWVSAGGPGGRGATWNRGLGLGGCHDFFPDCHVQSSKIECYPIVSSHAAAVEFTSTWKLMYADHLLAPVLIAEFIPILGLL